MYSAKGKRIVNAVGKLKITVQTTEDKTEVTRSLRLNKQWITPPIMQIFIG